MRRSYASYFLILSFLICLLCGCSAEKATLSEGQEAKVDLICQTVDEWGESVYDSFMDWPMNRIYISETESGMTVLTVGYLKSSKGALEGGTPVTTSFYMGVHAYAVMEDSKSIEAYYSDVGNWLDDGVPVDLEAMGEEALREAIAQSYLNFINQKQQEGINQFFLDFLNQK